MAIGCLICGGSHDVNVCAFAALDSSVGRLVDGVLIDYSGLPERHRDTVRLYIDYGFAPGSGWLAILSNNLRAVVMVDTETALQLPEIYRWMVNHAPSRAWGSEDKVRAWMKLERVTDMVVVG